jgi:tetratricopeptide (TPR) repeat protein
MLATLNSWGWKPIHSRKKGLGLWGILGWRALGIVLLLLAAPGFAHADDDSADTAQFSRHSEKAFQAAQARLQSEPTNHEAQWQFGRACFDWADYATTRSQRADIARQGIAACRKVIEADPESAPGHYYLALNLGQLARTKQLGALKIVDQMEEEFKICAGIDPQIEHAGPDRGLGLLYFQAPGWPTSIGNKSKARQHLQRALRLSPDFPENFLNLIEAELKWGDHNGALRELKALDALWPEAQKQFTGEEWAPSWADWQKRRAELWKKATGGTKAVETPRKL